MVRKCDFQSMSGFADGEVKDRMLFSESVELIRDGTVGDEGSDMVDFDKCCSKSKATGISYTALNSLLLHNVCNRNVTFFISK